MTRKLDIEAALDRSLANQVKVPRLDRRFDAGVWARIEAEEQRATNPAVRTKSRSSARWLFVSNVVGVTVAMLLVAIYGLQSFSGVSVSVPTPEVSAATADQILRIAALVITIVSVGFGLFFTPVGRRLRAELT
jgi:hypothetical protein